jgi:serine/threonine-protein kinase
LYSLGVVLYEMLAGDPPHTGSTVQQIVMKIVSEDAESVTTVRKSVPPHVAAALGKALEKLPADRFESAAAFAAALADQTFAVRHVTGTSSTARLPARRTTLVASVGVATGLVAGWFVWSAQEPPPLPVTRFTIPVPEGITMSEFYRKSFDIAPDGRSIAYITDNTLYLRSLERAEAEPLGEYPTVCCPRFTPDGRWIVFNNTLHAPTIRGVSAQGGPVVDMTAQLRDADLLRGPTSGRGVERRRPGASTWERLTELDTEGREGAHLWPQWLPGANHVLYTQVSPSLMWNGARVVAEDVATGERTTIAEEATYGQYLPTGHVIYIDADGTLYGVAFDAARSRVLGQPFVIDSGIRTAYWGGAASFAVSESGTLAFVRGSSWVNHRLKWVDRRGVILEQVGRPATVEGVRLSPDERYAATYVASNNSDISLFDLETGEDRRLTFEPETEDNPVWSGDGRRLAYRRVVSGLEHHIYVLDLDGRTPARQVYASNTTSAPRSWSSDGAALLFWGAEALMALELASGRVDTVATSVPAEGGRFSPDGRWIA